MPDKIKQWVLHYFHTKKPFTIVTDILFVVLILLLLIPGTRKEIAPVFIRMTSFAPSQLSQNEQYEISRQTKAWKVIDKDGRELQFGAMLDKPVFVNFWATWCPPCIAELPGISALYDEYKGRVHFLLLSNESFDQINGFSQNHGYESLPFYRYRAVPDDFSSRSIPTTFIVSQNGRVVLSKKGAARWESDKVRKLLDNLLSKQN
jgi:thiol-disulfide isomerase/thioredoxin